MSQFGLECFDGVQNMRRDVLLLEQCRPGSPAFRVYEWSQPWVTVGACQNVDRIFVEGCRTPWTRRPTGGKAVLHGHDVTFSYAVHLDDLGLDSGTRDVVAVYRFLTRPLWDALSACGLDVGYGSQKSLSNRSADCFAFAQSNDLTVGGAKVCGCAQRIYDKAALLQASIPVTAPLVEVEDVFLHPVPTRWLNIDPTDFCDKLSRAARVVRAK